MILYLNFLKLEFENKLDLYSRLLITSTFLEIFLEDFNLQIKHLIDPPCESIFSTSKTLRLLILHKSCIDFRL